MTRSAGIAGLRRRLQLEAALDTPNESGGFARAWQSLGAVWGEIETVRMGSEFAASRGEMTLTHLIKIRWRDGITGASQLRDGTRIFQIHAVREADSRQRYLICQCQEIKS